MLRNVKLPFTLSSRLSVAMLMAGIVLCAATLVAVNFWARHHYRAAEQALRDDRMPEARLHISQCLRVWRRDPATHLLAARIERVSNHYPDAERHLRECIRNQHGASETTQLEEILLRAQSGELKEVEAGLWKCVESNHPESSRILETLTRVYLRESRLGTALDCLDRWIEKEPRIARAWHWRGHTHQRLFQTEKARADYQMALDLDPERWECRLQLARLLLDSKNPEEALSHLEELERSHSNERDVMVALANSHHLHGEEEQAIQLLDRTLASHPDFFDALVLRGQLACQQQRPAEGEVWLRRALAQQPKDPRALYIFYQCLEKQGKESEAVKVLARKKVAEADTMRLSDLLTGAVERSPRDPDVLSEVGILWLRLGEDKAGLEWLYRALRENPNHKPSHEALLRYHQSKGDLRRAEQHRSRLAQLK